MIEDDKMAQIKFKINPPLKRVYGLKIRGLTSETATNITNALNYFVCSLRTLLKKYLKLLQ